MRSKQLQSCEHRPFLPFSHHLLLLLLLRESGKDDDDDGVVVDADDDVDVAIDDHGQSWKIVLSKKCSRHTF